MLGLQELSQQLERMVKSAVRFAKARKREEATIGLAAILFWIAYSFPKGLTPEFKAWVSSWHGLLIIPGVFYVVGMSLLCYGFYRIWRLVHTPDLPPPRDRPSAIKGPIAFTPADGELFRRLGREDELGKLLGFIEDDQVRLVVVMGASGVGKTSLLRAGLTNILKNKGIDYHYWEAVPTSPGSRLLRAIQESWQSRTGEDNAAVSPPSFGEPDSLEELVNPSSTLAEHRHVIVIDQFEQLHGSNVNSPVFRLIRKVAREAKPPHRVTWIVAFRREFRAEWEDLTLPEKERGIYPSEISLRLFTAEQARDVISQLISEAQLSIQQRVIDNLIEAATVDSELSPVDIGIGLLILAELHDRQGGQTVTLNDYRFAGGAEGLLTQYISRCLDIFSEADRETILKAMLALREPGTNRRVAEGRTCAELAQETKTEAARLKTQIERLTQRDVRLLETVAGSEENDDRYRIPHERLIPALHRIGGQLLAEVDQTKLVLENAFTAWRNSDRSRRYLLKSGELRAVERYETQIPWGQDAPEKFAFLRRSQQHRALRWIALAAMALCVMAAAWFAVSQYQRYDARTYLKDNNYPPELYDWQHQAKILQLEELISVQRFPWLGSNTLEELSIKVPRDTNSWDGFAPSLARCPALKKLTLDLTNSRVRELKLLTKLPALTQLTLIISGSEVAELTPLSELAEQTELNLDISSYSRGVKDLTPLTKLPALTQLTLDIGLGGPGFSSNIDVPDLTPLSQLTQLRELNLYLNGTTVSDLTWLSKLPALTRLTLDIRYSRVKDLTPLAKIRKLSQLKLYISDSEMRDLTALSQLSKLEEVSLDIGGSEVIDLTPLTRVAALKQLTLNIPKAKDLTPLMKLTAFRQLTLDLSGRIVFNQGSSGSGSRVSDLTPLAKLTAVTQLNLKLSHSEVRDLTVLTKLPELTQLALDIGVDYPPLESGFRWVSNANDLEPLSRLPGLTQLTLDLSYSEVRDLTLISGLSALTKLTLNISGSEVPDLTPLAQLTKLTELNLDLGGQVHDLTPLTKLPALTKLTLDITFSNVSDLTPLTKLYSCQTLILKSGAEQRMLLKAIPPSVTHLEF